MSAMQERTPKFSIGTSDFRKMREAQSLYVDKSWLIHDVIDQSAEVLLLPRPRRFGKTLNLSMLRYFFEKTPEDLSPLFQGLRIQTSALAQPHFQKYPVLFLTLKDVKASSWEDCKIKIRELLANLFREYKYLLGDNLLDTEEKEGFLHILQQTASMPACENALFNLSKYLHKYHQQRVLILIDEYDTCIHTAYARNYYDQAVSFFRNFLSAALKDNNHLFKGVLTGILRVAKESVFSGLNNLSVFSLIHPTFSSHFGFTEDEVLQLATCMHLSHHMDGIRAWYNGYLFGGQVIYNPWSIINFFNQSEAGLGPYWTNTSENDLIRKVVLEQGAQAKADLQVLLQGGSLDKPISDHIALRDVEHNEQVLWSFLLFLGYLKPKKLYTHDDELYGQLCIPNKEVQINVTRMTRDWFAELIGGNNQVSLLVQGLTKGDAEQIEASLSYLLRHHASSHDFGAEQSYHTFVLGLLVHASAEYEVKSNQESGYGRYDVALVPRERGRAGVLLELKMLRKEPTEAEVAAALESAFAQAEGKAYKTEFAERGIKSLHLFAVVFAGKRVWVKAKQLY